MKNKQLPIDGLQLAVTAITTILGFFAMLGIALYWLTEQATQGNQAATAILTGIVIFVTIFVILGVLLALIWGISKIQQSASQSNMELMRINALENQQLMNDVQKGLLIAAQTSKNQTVADMGNLRLNNAAQMIPPSQGQFLPIQNNQSNIIDNAFQEIDND